MPVISNGIVGPAGASKTSSPNCSAVKVLTVTVSPTSTSRLRCVKRLTSTSWGSDGSGRLPSRRRGTSISVRRAGSGPAKTPRSYSLSSAKAGVM